MRVRSRVGIAGVIVAVVLTLTALMAASASAAPKKLDLTWDFEVNQLKTGEEFKMANDSDIAFETTAGGVKCEAAFYPEEQGFLGKDETNNEKTDKLELDYAYGGIYLGRVCASTLGLGTEALVAVYNPSGSLGTLSLGANGKASFKTPSTSEPAYVLEYFLNTGDECYYTFTKLSGTLSIGDLTEIDFSNQKLKLDKTISNKLCPKTAKLTAPFEYQTTGELGWYIFNHLTS
jgi:hypothetical protein